MGLIIVPGQDGPEPEPEPREYSELISPQEIDRWVGEAIQRNRTIRRATLSQETVDRTVEVLYQEGELYLAAALLMLMSARISGHESTALSILMQLMVDLRSEGAIRRQCRVCGCTDERACEGGCEWVEIDLCSVCDRKLRVIYGRAAGRPS